MYTIQLDGGEAIVNGERIPYDISAGDVNELPTETSSTIDVMSELPGKILSINVQKGAKVQTGDVLLIMEALKMEIEVVSPTDGVISNVAVQVQQQVASGDVLLAIR